MTTKTKKTTATKATTKKATKAKSAPAKTAKAKAEPKATKLGALDAAGAGSGNRQGTDELPGA